MLNRSKLSNALVASLMAAGLAAVPAAYGAGQPQPPQAQPAPDLSDVEVADSEVELFANLYLQTQRLRAQYQQRMQNAEDQQAQQQLQQEARQEILSVIRDSSMSVERYRTIAQASRQDEDLKQEIVSELRALQGMDQQGGGSGG